MIGRGQLACVVVLSVASVARAEGGPSADDIRAAAEEFDAGKRAYKSNRWVEAAEHFEEADSRAPSATALELAIRARDKARQLDRAATLAGLALTRHPDEAALAKTARGVIGRADKELHKLAVRCSPACEVVVGTKLAHGGPGTEHRIYLQPGGVPLHASWSGGRTRTAPIKAVAGGSSEISFQAPAEDDPAGATPKTEPTRTGSEPPAVEVVPPSKTGDRGGEKEGGGLPPVVFFVGAGLTAVAGGITVWSGLDTIENPGQDTVRSECAGQGTDCPAYQDGLSAQRRTNVLIGVTSGLGLATGVVGLFFTDWSSGERKAKARVEPWVGIAQGAAVGARGVF